MNSSWLSGNGIHALTQDCGGFAQPIRQCDRAACPSSGGRPPILANPLALATSAASSRPLGRISARRSVDGGSSGVCTVPTRTCAPTASAANSTGTAAPPFPAKLTSPSCSAAIRATVATRSLCDGPSSSTISTKSTGSRSIRSAAGCAGSVVITRPVCPRNPAMAATTSGWSMARWIRLAPTCSASMAARSRWPSGQAAGAMVIRVPGVGARSGIDQQCPKEGRIDIAAGYDGDGPAARQLAAVMPVTGRRDRAARFGHQPRLQQQPSGGVGNLVLGDGDDVVHLGADVLPGQLTDTEGPQPVGHGPGGQGGRPGNSPAGGKRLGGVAG